MLADLTLLLHEMSDALRGRAARPRARRGAIEIHAAIGLEIVVTGLASPGKARLIEALERQFAGVDVDVRTAPPSAARDKPVLRVHAETDVEALVEGAREGDARRAATSADLVVPVDWEPVARSVARVTEALVARGANPADLGV